MIRKGGRGKREGEGNQMTGKARQAWCGPNDAVAFRDRPRVRESRDRGGMKMR